MVEVNKPITKDFIKQMGNEVPILETITNKCYVKQTGKKTFKIILTQGLNRQIGKCVSALTTGFDFIKN